MTDLSIDILTSLNNIPADDWNRISGTSNPFIRYAFLHSLEASASTNKHNGWTPHHILIRQKAELIGVIPGYLKSHSYGEYVFDWSWAEAYQRYQLNYYPKLLTAIPFTPSIGPRLLLRPEFEQCDIITEILKLLIAYLKESNIPSWHLLFPDKPAYQTLLQANTEAGSNLIIRHGCQFHWQNNHYLHFDNFLADLNSRKRKNIRKEREKVNKQGIEFQILEGKDINQSVLDIYYPFYQATYLKRGQSPYLHKAFFQQVCEKMPEQIILCMAKKDGDFVAGAWFFKSENTLYGRNWGCLEEYKNLHFECCYYQGIEYCINQGLAFFDAGAQGEHKIQRGFRPMKTHSFHWIAHEGFQPAISAAVKEENTHIEHYIRDANEHLPFKEEPLKE
jgi:predicted N-acyltransferase